MRPNVFLAPIMASTLLLAGCGSEPQDEAAAPAESPAAEAAAPAEEVAQADAAPADAPPPAFAQCRSCHLVEPGKNSVGPSLAGVFGKPAASVPGFQYSPALKAAGITWDRASLDTWLAGPMQMVPGTRMVLAVRDEAQRKAIIDYLETLQ